MTIYKEFLGLNYCIYEPTLEDTGAAGGNTLGYSFASPYTYSDSVAYNPNIAQITSHNSSRTMVLLNLHRNGPFGYPMWKQIRSSENHLTRAQKRRNIFTYVEEPGSMLNSHQSRYGNIQSFTDPVVVDSYKPVSLIGNINVYNDQLKNYQDRSVELKTSLGNETAFFANSEINDYFETIVETDDNYEQLKDLYLDGGLEDEGSPIDSFNMFVYRQSIYPKQQYAFLDDTRSRNYYVNTFWRSERKDRTELNVSAYSASIPSQSMWPLDAREDFISRTPPASSVPAANYESYAFDIGGKDYDNSESGPGVLQNRHSTFMRGVYNHTPAAITANQKGKPAFSTGGYASTTVHVANILTASIEYSRLHTLKNVYSPVNPSGPRLVLSELMEDRVSTTPKTVDFLSMPTSSIFNGRAAWDAPVQSGKEPFYDSYDLFSAETRAKGKSYSIIPEFKISNHVEFYSTNGILESLDNIFEISGATKQNSTTQNEPNFYKVLSNSDFMKHFEMIQNDHRDFSKESILTLKCSAIKKFLPYEGFYPAERTVDVANQFSQSYAKNIEINLEDPDSFTDFDEYDEFALKPLFTPLFSPGILFNTIKSGMAVDFPLIFTQDLHHYNPAGGVYQGHTFGFYDDHEILNQSIALPLGNPYGGVGSLNNALLGHSVLSREFNSFRSIYSARIPFEALLDPESYLANKNLTLQEPHPFALSDAELEAKWDGTGNDLYKKMISNFLAEVPEFFADDQNFKTITSLEEQDPMFGNAESGSFYLMRLKMTKSRNKSNLMLGGYGGFPVIPPQDVVGQSGSYANDEKFTTRETLTMYSRPSAFGPPSYGDAGYKKFNGIDMRMGSSYGFNFPYTPPYYHGEAWCDLIFECTSSKKYTVEEILNQVKEYPYYTRYWSPLFHDAMRDLTGYQKDDLSAISSWSAPALPSESSVYHNYSGSTAPWSKLINGSPIVDSVYPVGSNHPGAGGDWPNNTDFWSISDNNHKYSTPHAESAHRASGPQSPYYLNYNAMQLNSTVNIFGKGTVKTVDLSSDGQVERVEVASGDTVRGKTRWIIQPKFECPILNFNKYVDLSDASLKCTPPTFAKSQVPRGMWHQYGDLPADNEGIFLQISDIPDNWLRGALGVERRSKRVKSLADLVGFSKDPVRLGEVADVKEISEAVVAVPFIEKDGTRQFFSIPREDIDSCIGATKREVDPGTFVAGGPPKAGDSVYQMVKKMQKYVFPPSMDFVKYKEIDPFAMYVFEFKHNLSKQDLADIWQNLPPDIGTRMEEAEATISHELLAHELLGGGAVVKNGTLDENAEGDGIPSNIQWMIFKAKKRAKTNYFDKVVAKKGTTEDTSNQQLENTQGQIGNDLGITYNWPYDFFSLVELVKIDAEVTFANIENDDKGQKTIKKVEKKNPLEVSKSRAAARGINIARGKGKPNK